MQAVTRDFVVVARQTKSAPAGPAGRVASLSRDRRPVASVQTTIARGSNDKLVADAPEIRRFCRGRVPVVVV